MADPRGPLAERGLIKVCGLTDAPSIAAAVRGGADMIGLVFVEGSARAVSVEDAGRLARCPRGGAVLVGLFQDPALSEIEAVLEHVPLDLLQLHGAETPDDVARIGAGFGLPVIKAIGVSGPADLSDAYPADMMLYDAKPPAGLAVAGGHGRAFDWSVLRMAAHARPFMLAGGLTPGTVGEAVAACAAIPGFAGVDVSSGVEASRGIKDPDRIARFLLSARTAMVEAEPGDA